MIVVRTVPALTLLIGRPNGVSFEIEVFIGMWRNSIEAIFHIFDLAPLL
jgi:hypothetical protein